MKNILLTVVALFIVVCYSHAQTDTMYIMKSGAVIAKYNVTEQMDSVIFYNPDEVSEGTEIAFDAAKVVSGDFEENGNLRIEIYNEYGTTKSDPPFDPASVVFSSRLEITFTLQGVTLNAGAVGTYDTAMGIADADWSAQYWGDGPGEVKVNGDGTYTVYCDLADFDTALVFVVDIKGLFTDLADPDAVTATVDKIVVN